MRKTFGQTIAWLSTRPFLLFLPFFFLYVILVLLLDDHVFKGDEKRYYQYATNLLDGFYSPPAPDVTIVNGPGYPFLLMPFVAFKLPLITITLLNAVFQYLSIVFLYKTMRYYASIKLSLGFSLFWGCYYTVYVELSQVYTEPLICFLLTSFMFCLVLVFKFDKKKYIWLAGFLLGYMLLTKIAFFYGIAVMLVFCGVMMFFAKKGNDNYRKQFYIMGIAFLMMSPYIVYTSNISGRPFYLGGPGGSLLYYMSSPHEDEFGDWKGIHFKKEKVLGLVPLKYEDSMTMVNHRADLEYIVTLTELEQDAAFKKMAIENIKKYPTKYVKNWVFNIGRLLYDFPVAHLPQKVNQFIKLPPNTITVLLTFFCLIPALMNWRKIDYLVKFLLFFVLLYIGPVTLVSAYSRFFHVIVPILLFFIVYTLQWSIRIRLTKPDHVPVP